MIVSLSSPSLSGETRGIKQMSSSQSTDGRVRFGRPGGGRGGGAPRGKREAPHHRRVGGAGIAPETEQSGRTHATRVVRVSEEGWIGASSPNLTTSNETGEPIDGGGGSAKLKGTARSFCLKLVCSSHTIHPSSASRPNQTDLDAHAPHGAAPIGGGEGDLTRQHDAEEEEAEEEEENRRRCRRARSGHSSAYGINVARSLDRSSHM